MQKYFLDFVKLLLTFRLLKDVKEMKRRIVENSSFKDLHNNNFLEEKISLVVPTKNEENYIRRFFESVEKAKSLVPNIEVLVVDYKSVDDTLKIAKDFNAKIIECNKPGVGYASFIGVKNAAGEIIVRCDADLVLNPHALIYAIDKLRDYKIVNLGHIYYDGGFKENLIAFLYDKYWREPFHTTGHFIAFRKEITQTVNFNQELKYDDDWDFGFRAYKILGIQAFHYNYWISNFVSARRIRNTGFLKYIYGKRKR